MTDGKTSSLAATVSAALCPLLIGALTIVMVPVAGRGATRAWMMFMEAGWAAWLVLFAWLLGTVVLAVLLALAARGVRIPSALTIAVAALPWIVGALGTIWSLRMVRDVLSAESIDASQRARIMAMGIAEASANRVLGAVFSTGLLIAVAIGLGIAAIGRRAEGPRLAGAAVGCAAALPLLGGALYVLVTGGGVAALVIVAFPAVLSVIALGLAGAAVGADSRHGRAAELAAAAPVAAGLALMASAAATLTIGVRAVLEALGASDPSQRLLLASAGAEELMPSLRLERWGGVLLIVSVIVLAAWAVRAARPSGGRIAGAVALALVALSVVGLDRLVSSRAESSVAEISIEPWWQGVSGYTAATLNSTPLSGEVHAVLTADALHLPSGAPIPLSELGGAERKAATERLARMLQLARALHGPPPGAGAPGGVTAPPKPSDNPGTASSAPRPGASNRYGVAGPQTARQRALKDAAKFGMLGLLSGEDAAPAFVSTPNERPSLSVAVDARVSVAQLKQLLGAASDAGARSVVLVGITPRTPEQEEQSEAIEKFPFFAALSQPVPQAQRVFLKQSLSEGAANYDPMLWHGTVQGEDAPLRLQRRKGAGQGRTIEPRAEEPPLHQRVDKVGYLRLGAGATPAALADAAWRLEAGGFWPLVVADDIIPGNPDGEAERRGLGLGLGSAHGTLGDPAAAPRLRMGSAGVSGRLPPEVIRRIVRQRFAKFRSCYERGLKDDPKLAGRVKVRFVIETNGEVSQASDAGSDLPSQEVVRCVIDVYETLIFPRPEGGVVSVVYPIMFKPAD